MIMLNVLQGLFKAANIIAIIMLSVSYILTIIAKKRKSTLASANIVFPVFSEQHSMIKHCFWAGVLFIGLEWLLCSSGTMIVDTAVEQAAEQAVEQVISVNSMISQATLSFAVVWAVMFFVGLLVEIILKFMKTTSTNSYSVMPGVKSSLWYAVLCFVLSFLIA